MSRIENYYNDFYRELSIIDERSNTFNKIEGGIFLSSLSILSRSKGEIRKLAIVELLVCANFPNL